MQPCGRLPRPHARTHPDQRLEEATLRSFDSAGRVMSRHSCSSRLRPWTENFTEASMPKAVSDIGPYALGGVVEVKQESAHSITRSTSSTNPSGERTDPNSSS